MCFGTEPQSLTGQAGGETERVSLTKEALQRIKWRQKDEREIKWKRQKDEQERT